MTKAGGLGPIMMKPWKDESRDAANRKGRFIVFEGIDGAGKSTQARMLAEWMRRRGWKVLLTAEPSDGPVGRRIRALKTRPAPEEEARLFTEDRRNHVAQVILPALEAGRIVICDRYVYSSVAYQGARGIDIARIASLNRAFAVEPDVIFLLEIPIDAALSRIERNRGRGTSPFELRETLDAVDRIYKTIEGPGIQRIEARNTIAEIHARIVNFLTGPRGFDEFRRGFARPD